MRTTAPAITSGAAGRVGDVLEQAERVSVPPLQPTVGNLRRAEADAEQSKQIL